MIKSWDDLFKAVSKECRMNEDLPDFLHEDIEFFHKHLWKGVRYYLQHPLEAKYGILLQGFIKFKFKQKNDLRKHNIKQLLF